MTRVIVSSIQNKVSCIRIEPRNFVDNTDPGDPHYGDPDAPPSQVRLAAYPVDILVPGSSPPRFYIGTGEDDKTTFTLNDTPSPTTIELTGVLGIGGITRDLILMKYFEGAKVYFFATCWTNFVENEEKYGVFLWGKTTINDDDFTVELTHISDLLKQNVAQSYTKLCSNVFKDTIIDYRSTTPINTIGTCDPDEALVSFGVTGSNITNVISSIEFQDNILAGLLPDDWFGNGQITFNKDTISHGRDQRVFEIISYDGASGTFKLAEPPLLGGISVGMYYEAIVGCRKRFVEDCKGKFNNGVNFGGFNDIPLPSQSGEIGNLSG